MTEPPPGRKRRGPFQPAPSRRTSKRTPSTAAQNATHEDYIQNFARDSGRAYHNTGRETANPSHRAHPQTSTRNYAFNPAHANVAQQQPPQHAPNLHTSPFVPTQGSHVMGGHHAPENQQRPPNGTNTGVPQSSSFAPTAPQPTATAAQPARARQGLYKLATEESLIDMRNELQDLITNKYQMPYSHAMVKLLRSLAFLHKKRSEMGERFATRCNHVYSLEFSVNNRIRSKSVTPVRSTPRPIPEDPPPAVPMQNMSLSAGASRASGPHRQATEIEEVAQHVVNMSHPPDAPRGASPEPSSVRQQHDAMDIAQEIVPVSPLQQKRNNLKAHFLKRFSEAQVTWSEVPKTKNDAYCLWTGNDSHVSALLPRSMLTPFEELQNINRELTVTQAIVLRFLWLSLVVSDEEGACLCGSMGLIRIHQVLVFASMYFSAHRKSNPCRRILVVVPHNTQLEWHGALQKTPKMFSRFVIPNSEPEAISRTMRSWGKLGGLLVCSEELYGQLTSQGAPMEQKFARDLLVRPGPNIVILDEASRFPLMDRRVCRMLRQTQTKARLALTSVSLGGNMESLWHVLDWTCPSLLGDLEEFRNVYIRRIAQGHCIGSSNSAGQRAYRTAASLFAFAHPVLFPSLGLYKVDKYMHRRERVDSITIYTNVIGRQMGIYRAIARNISKRVERGQLSAFVAAHVLTVAGTSPAALKLLLKNGAERRPRCMASLRLEKELRQVQVAFEDLLRLVEHRLSPDMNVAKVAICKRIYEKCVDARENVIIFTHSMEVQNVLYDMLTKRNKKGGLVLKWDTELPFDARSRLLARFQEHEGACLIAPYGPTLNCRETSGWGDLSVAVVVIVDSGWHAIAEAQCVKRLFNPINERVTRRVQVINLVSVNTIEQFMYVNLLSSFDLEVRRIRECDGLTAAPMHETVEKRSYLVCPEIHAEWLIDHRGEDDMQQKGSADADEATSSAMSYDADHLKIINSLWDVQVSHSFAVNRISARYNRVAAVACAAEMCTRAPLRIEDNNLSNSEIREDVLFHEEAVQAICKQIDNASSIESTHEVSLHRLLNSEDGSLRPDGRMQLHQVSSLCTLAALWEPYYDLYDRGHA